MIIKSSLLLVKLDRERRHKSHNIWQNVDSRHAVKLVARNRVVWLQCPLQNVSLKNLVAA